MQRKSGKKALVVVNECLFANLLVDMRGGMVIRL